MIPVRETSDGTVARFVVSQLGKNVNGHTNERDVKRGSPLPAFDDQWVYILVSKQVC